MSTRSQVISALRDKQREIRTAFQAKWDEFKVQDKAWKGWSAEERKKRWVHRPGEIEQLGALNLWCSVSSVGELCVRLSASAQVAACVL